MKRAALLLLTCCFAARGFGQNWIEQYASESVAANKSCRAKDYADCRTCLLRLNELLDGRADIVYRLASVEALLGNRGAALEWLSLFSRTGLTFADPASDADFASLKDSAEFAPILSRVKSAREPVSNSKPFQTLPERDSSPKTSLMTKPAAGFSSAACGMARFCH